MKFSVSIESGTCIRLHAGMPKNPVTGKEFLKLCVTCNDRLWTENKVDSLRLRDPSNWEVRLQVLYTCSAELGVWTRSWSWNSAGSNSLLQRITWIWMGSFESWRIYQKTKILIRELNRDYRASRRQALPLDKVTDMLCAIFLILIPQNLNFGDAIRVSVIQW